MIDPCSVPDKDQRPVIEWQAALMRKVPDLAIKRNLEYVGRLMSAGKSNPRQVERDVTEAQDKWTDGPDGVQPRGKVRAASSKIVEEAVVPLGHAVSMVGGESGKTLTTLLQRMHSMTQREYNTIENDFREVAGPELSDKQRATLHEFMDAISVGKKVPIKDPEVARVATAMLLVRFPDKFAHATAQSLGLSTEQLGSAKKLADWMSNSFSMVENRATNEGLPFNPWSRSKYLPVMLRLRDLFPDLYPSSTTSEQATRETKAKQLLSDIVDQVHRNLNKEGGDTLTRVEIHAALKRWAEFGETPQFRRPLAELMVKADKHLELHRLLDTTIGIEWDPHLIFRRYFRPALLRLNYAKVFGVNGEVASKLMDQAATDKQDVKHLMRLFDFAAEQQTFGRAQTPRLLRELAGIVSFHSLGNSVISQFTTGPRILEHVARTGRGGVRGFIEAGPSTWAKIVVQKTPSGLHVSPFLRGWLEAFPATIAQMHVIPENVRAKLGSRLLAKWVAESGGMVAAEELGAIARSGGLFPKIAVAQLHLTGMTTVDRFARNWAALSGRHYMEFLQEQLDWSRRRGDRAEVESTLRHMNEVLGGDSYWLDMAKATKEPLTSEQRTLLQQIAGETVHNRTQFRTLPIDLPLMANHPVGKMFYKLQSYGYRTTAETMRQFNLADPKSIMRNPVGRLRFLAALLGPTMLSSYAILRAKRYLQGKDPNPDDPFWRQFVDVMAFAGVGTQIQNTLDEWTGKYGSPEKQIGGPVMSTAIDMVASGGASMKQKSWDPTLRFMIRSMPTSFQVPLGLPRPSELAKQLVPPRKKPKSSPFAPAAQRTRPFKPIGS